MIRPFRKLKSALVFQVFVLVSSPAFVWSQTDQTLENKLNLLLLKIEKLSETVERQQLRIKNLEEENSKLQPQGTPARPDPKPVVQTVPSQTTSFNPEIGIVADITGVLSESSEDHEGNDKLSVRELEIVFGHDIDPYSRFDSTITFSDFEDPAIEEAYITHWGLPWDIKARLGRMRPTIGKANRVHRDQLDTADFPFVLQEYLGVEGLYRTGIEGSSYLPWSSASITQELTLGLMEGGIGEEGTLFGSTKRRPSYYSHLKNFWEMSEEQNLELGISYLLGSADEDSNYEVHALGLDATYVNYLSASSRLKFQSEFFFQDRTQAASEEEDGHELHRGLLEQEALQFDKNPFGFYVLGDYRFSSQFGLGARFDYVEPVNFEDSHAETLGYTGYLTFYQSEFLRFRLQYQHVDFPTEDDNRFFLQATAAIGTHKHQLQ
ncbi:MAG: hypothetical protein KDD62_07620 [Bdellovibrionales bacterium]|nr:hypothetical protein [Bdellovibrionales bacterium]